MTTNLRQGLPSSVVKGLSSNEVKGKRPRKTRNPLCPLFFAFEKFRKVGKNLFTMLSASFPKRTVNLQKPFHPRGEDIFTSSEAHSYIPQRFIYLVRLDTRGMFYLLFSSKTASRSLFDAHLPEIVCYFHQLESRQPILLTDLSSSLFQSA